MPNVAEPGVLRHRCSGGKHQALICKIVDHKLEFQCDGCKEKFYWDEHFLAMLVDLVQTGGKGFYCVFE